MQMKNEAAITEINDIHEQNTEFEEIPKSYEKEDEVERN